MVVIFVWATPKEAKAPAFELALEEIARAARQLPGCLSYQWYYAATPQPSQYIIYGEFDAQASFDAYLRSDVVKHIGQQLLPLLEGKPTYKHYLATVFKEG
jgi:quinol monooxygenase YgiN